MPKLGHISHYLTPPPVNLGEGGQNVRGEQSVNVVAQGGSVRFWYFPLFWNHNASEATGVENRRQISYFLTLCTI